jgi:flagellar assembly protein FliH
MTQLSDPSVLVSPRQDATAPMTVSEWVPSPHTGHRADEAIAAARAEGFAAGRAAALAEGEAARRSVSVARTAFDTAAATLQQASAARVHLDGEELAELTYGLTEALLGRELEYAPNAWRDAVARALHGVEPTLDLVIRLHPSDAQHATASELMALRHRDGHSLATADLRVVADATIEPGGCVAEIGSGRIDAQIGSALQRVARALGVTPGETTAAGSPDADALGEATA